jgi:hypothetical protein
MWNARWVPLCLAMAGCAHRQLREAPPEEGVVRSYIGAFEEVQKAALDALCKLELPASERRWIDRGRWCALGRESRPFGRAARVVVEDHPVECRVWVLGPAEEIHAALARALGQEARAETSRAPAGEREARYRASIDRCFERLARACRERGYAVLREDAEDPALKTLSAERKPAPRLFAALYRLNDEGTRVVVEVRGGAAEEIQAEAARVHADLLKELPALP